MATTNRNTTRMREDALIARATKILERRLCMREESLGNEIMDASSAGDFLRFKLHASERERFFAFFLDARHRVIAHEELFRGTLDQVSVYPREIVKAALMHNAAAVIVAHNHPSGKAVFSLVDRAMTDLIRKALNLVGVSLLDHFLVSGNCVMSLASLEEMEEAQARRNDAINHQRSITAKAARRRQRARAIGAAIQG